MYFAAAAPASTAAPALPRLHGPPETHVNSIKSWRR